MQTKKSPIVSCLTVAAAALMTFATASPAQDTTAAGNFQSALQQQNFYTILSSIEERLRSLNNIYSMQLSQTLETKLEQYSRRLEALDSKIIRLEAIVMLNLDKISENISMKNFKDDMTKTTTFRKMDSIYEGISHRLGYMERKFETNMAKIQTKVDATITRFEKLEDNLMTRDSDIEAEMSDVIFAIDDLKTTCVAMEQKLYNISSATLNFTKSGHKTSQDMYVTTRKSMNVLHDNIIETLQYMNNRTSRHFKVADENNAMLKDMKNELKTDFNNYANKVADMSSYAGKSSDVIENNLKLLESIANNTKTEVQNGVRSLMVQIGKMSNKENAILSDNNSLEEINKNLKTNFDRILTNQDLFLESCHRVQMDESQIETEISVTLENLINMLEKKMNLELKDIKNMERALKAHDNRVMRNMHQINTNVISLFQKSTTNTESMRRDMIKIGKKLEDIFSLLQNISKSGPRPLDFLSVKVLQEKLIGIERMISRIPSDRIPNLNSPNVTDNLYENIERQLQSLSKNLTSIEVYLKDTLNEKNFNQTLYKVLQKHFINCKVVQNDVMDIDDETGRLIEKIFGVTPSSVTDNADTGTTEYKQNYIDIIDVRMDIPDVEKNANAEDYMKNNTFLDLGDVNSNFENVEYNESTENFDSTTFEYFVPEEIATTKTTIINDMYNITETTLNNTVNKI